MSEAIEQTDEPSSIRLHPNDDVVVAVRDIAPDTLIEVEAVRTIDTIPAGHKIATSALDAGDEVRKYDQVIGFATTAIHPGEHVHVHNIEFRDFERTHAFGTHRADPRMIPADERARFQGFRRADGRAATRNFIGVLTTVNCSATVARQIADHFRGPIMDTYPGVDGVVALTHGWGCGMGTPEGHLMVQRAVGGYARHPNFAGIVMVALGCEGLQLRSLMERESLIESDTFRPITIQDAGSRAALDAGIAAVAEMLPVADRARREPIPVDELVLALECGGSDAYSGISANPALGAAADLLVAHGGTAVLAETPEIFGAEHLLARRALDDRVGAKLLELIEWWKDYASRNGASLDNNPSPGNKAGGLSTILEKSLGAAAKGGTTTLMDVYRYAEPITSQGFVFMDSPGYDPASVTGMVAGGANIACFTTGRGSVFGSKPVPCLKIATNTELYRRMELDIDVNAGVVIDGEMGADELGALIFERIITTASGEHTRSEEFGVGDHEFVPWAAGAML